MDCPTKTTAEQIDVWRAAESENEHLEFKEAKNQFDFKTLMGYCVAFANERGGKLLLGIANWPPRPVVGTNAFPDTSKIAKAIFDKFGFRVDIEEVQHPEGRVLVFHIPSRPTGHPHHLDGAYLMRVGESLVPMTQDQLKRIITEERSYRRAVIFTVVVLLVLSIIGSLGFRYWKVGITPKQSVVKEGAAEASPIAEKPSVVVKQSERKSKSATHDSASSMSQDTRVSGPVDWHDKHNWRAYLRVGMTRKEVRRLFGEPEKMSVVSDEENWDYGSGSISFWVDKDSPDGRLNSWFEPDQ